MKQGFYSESTTLSYYACYQAMWVAVGDPPAGLWRHGGLMNEFCRARWQQRPALLRKRLDRLYLYRIQSDYEARALGMAEAQEGLDIAEEVLRIVSQHGGLAL
ncbi:MAG: HEPN domain-containing protein [Candidatus Bipolaricaulota bacterium]|nr:HEPN domain-containing protein [Candidatus Bipolaricaulota bacterium]